MEKLQYVYLIECQGYYKIGVAENLKKRIVHLQIGNPFELNLLAAYLFADARTAESNLHREFYGLLVRGEWFKLSSYDVDVFHNVCVSLGGEMMPVDDVVEWKKRISDAGRFNAESGTLLPLYSGNEVDIQEAWRLFRAMKVGD